MIRTYLILTLNYNFQWDISVRHFVYSYLKSKKTPRYKMGKVERILDIWCNSRYFYYEVVADIFRLI